MFRSQDPELSASGPNDHQDDMSETPELDLNALCHNDTQEDLSQTPELDLNALCHNDTREDLSQTPELDSQEDDVPEPTNRIEDYPTPPDLRVETKSKYDELTASSDDELVSPGTSAPRHRIFRLQRAPRWEFPKLTDLECVNFPELGSYVNNKSFSTDEDSDGEYSEFPLNS